MLLPCIIPRLPATEIKLGPANKLFGNAVHYIICYVDETNLKNNSFW